MGRNDFLVNLEEELEKQNELALDSSGVELDKISTIKISMGENEKEEPEGSNKDIDAGDNFKVSQKENSNEIDKIEPISVISQIVDTGISMEENEEDSSVMMEIFRKNSIKQKRKKIVMFALLVITTLIAIGGIGFGLYQNRDILSNLYGDILIGSSTNTVENDNKLRQLEQENNKLHEKVQQLSSVQPVVVTSTGMDDLMKKNKSLENKKLELLADIELLKKENKELADKKGTTKKIEELTKNKEELEKNNKELSTRLQKLEVEISKIRGEGTGNTQTGLIISIDSLKNIEVKDFYEFYRNDLSFIKSISGDQQSIKNNIIKINLLVASWDKKEISYNKFRLEYNRLISKIIQTQSIAKQN